MAKRAVPDEKARRLAAGLSPILLDHAETGQNFLGFLSYRRGDGLSLARWLRSKITSFRVPKELQKIIDARDASVGGKGNRVFFDMSYQKPNVDFWDEHIAASLCRSRTLILLQTPSVFEKLPDGSLNWCEREIETFLKYYNDPSRILVVMGPGAPIDKFPAPLEKISDRWDWIDLRFFSQSLISRFRNASSYDAQIVKVLAKIYDIADGDLPILGREFQMVRQRARRNLAVAALATIVALSGLTVWALQERQTAIAQRNSALVSQSRYLATVADRLVSVGTSRNAVALLHEALPDPAAGNNRPLVPEAITAAYKAMYSNHERDTLPLPEGTTAIATDAMHGIFVFATKDQLVINGGFGSKDQISLPLDFGKVAQIKLAPDDKTVALATEDGAISLRSLAGKGAIMNFAGEGQGTTMSFVNKGAALMVTDEAHLKYHLFDAVTGAEIASRTLTPTGNKAVKAYFDPDTDFMAVVADAKLTKLSPKDLSDAATLPIDDRDTYAFALTEDKSSLYIAAADYVLDGRLLEVDAQSWTLKRGFSNIAWGATKLDVSTHWNTLALIGGDGVDFFNLKLGERMSRVSVDIIPTSGRFIGGTDNSEYMVWDASGSMRWLSSYLNEQSAAFTVSDGSAVLGVDALPDNRNFISITDPPRVTRWSYKVLSSARSLTVELINKKFNMDMGMASHIQARDYKPELNLSAGSYTGDEIYRWDVAKGEKTLVKDTDGQSDNIPFVAILDKTTTAAADATGKISIYNDAGGSAKPVGEIEAGPLSTFTAVSPTQIFAVTKDGVPQLLDVRDPAKPKLAAMPDLGACPLSVATGNIAICANSQGGLKAKRIADGHMLLQVPESAKPFVRAAVSKDGSKVVLVGETGHVEVRSTADGKVVFEEDVTVDLSGSRLRQAQASGKLTADEKAQLRTGASHLIKSFVPLAVDFAPDGKQLSLVMNFGVVQIIDLETLKKTEIRLDNDRLSGEVIFSANSVLTGIHTFKNVNKQLLESLDVYRKGETEPLASISLTDIYQPKIFALGDGTGYLAVSEDGQIIVEPVFEKDEAFLAYLAREYPERLTSVQRHHFFLE